MFQTKLDDLHDILQNYTPNNEKYENYISNFDSGSCCVFVINKNNINRKKLYNDIRKCGYNIVSSKSINNNQIKLIITEMQW